MEGRGILKDLKFAAGVSIPSTHEEVVGYGHGSHIGGQIFLRLKLMKSPPLYRTTRYKKHLSSTLYEQLKLQE